MNQLAIDFTRARRTDPHTSHEAAARVSQFAHGHYAAILNALRKRDGQTIWDLEANGVLDHVEAARRISELERQGKVCWQGERKSPSGRNCRVWWVV